MTRKEQLQARAVALKEQIKEQERLLKELTWDSIDTRVSHKVREACLDTIPTLCRAILKNKYSLSVTERMVLHYVRECTIGTLSMHSSR